MKPGIYKHYKGDLVEVLGTAKHSETLEEMVVYKHVSGPKADEQHYWVRPLSMFKETVQKDGFKGPRFEFVK